MSLNPLNEDLNIISSLVIPELDEDLDVIQKLDDEPNDVGGLTASELKAEFDKAGNIIKDYINNELLPKLFGTIAEEEERENAEAERVQAEQGRVTAEKGRVTAEQARVLAEQGRVSAEQERVQAEKEREDAEQAREDATTGIVAQATVQAKAAAQSAKDAAAARDAIVDLEVASTELPAGSTPTVTKSTTSTGNVLLTFGQVPGPQGDRGPAGANATINGVNALTLTATGGLSAKQIGSELTIDGSDLQSKEGIVTLTTSNWSASGSRFKQTVQVSGVSASTAVVIVDVHLTGDDLDADNDALSAWLSGPSMCNVEQGDGTLTFYSAKIPTQNIPVKVGVC